MTEKNILEQALEITSGDRNKFYGHPLDNHSNTAEFWSGYLFRKFGVRLALTPRDVCLMMVLLKVSRDANSEKLDNLVDIVGYTRNIEMIDEERKRRAVFDSKTRTADNDMSACYYLAGPMRGYPRFNFDMFETATNHLRRTGENVASPHEHDLEMGLDPDKPLEEQPDWDMAEAFRWDIGAVMSTRGIILLPGWEKSQGARTEAKVALFCNKEIRIAEHSSTGYWTHRMANDLELEEILHHPSMPPAQRSVNFSSDRK